MPISNMSMSMTLNLNIFCKYISLLFWLNFLLPINLLAQSNYFNSNPVLQKAHNRKIEKVEFTPTDATSFLVKIYKVSNAVANKTHHWFIKLADPTGKPLNYARIQVNGHLKSNPAIPLAYQGNVIALCTEGKYIIGFVKVAKSGIYQLNATVDNFGQVDTFSYEIEIGK